MQKRILSPIPFTYPSFFISALFLLIGSLTRVQAQAPDNDDCANAIALPSLTNYFGMLATTVGATQSLSGIICNGYSGTSDDDIWYKFTAVSTYQFVTVIGTSGFDAVVDVRSGGCNGVTIGCADATTSGGTEVVRLTDLTIGSTYYIRVYSYGSDNASRGIFGVGVTHSTLANDECTGAITLTSFPSYTGTQGTTVGAAQSMAPLTCNTHTGASDDDVWYKFVAVSSEQTVKVIGNTGFNAVVDIRSGDCGGTTIQCADYAIEDGPEEVVLSDLTIGSTYYIRIYSFGNTLYTRGTFEVGVSYNLPNDDCTNAIEVYSFIESFPSFFTQGNTGGATQSLPAITCHTYTGTADDDIWYKFVAIAYEHTITVRGFGRFDPVVDVRSGACNGTSIGCADATANGGTETVTVSYLIPGNTYYIRIYGYGGSDADRGRFILTLTHSGVPYNDECKHAVLLTSLTTYFGTIGTTKGATQSLAAITCNGLTGTANDDVWYKFVAVSTRHRVTVIGVTEFNPVVDVRSGTCDGINIGCADATTAGGTETVDLTGLTIGSTYYIRIYSFGSTSADSGIFGVGVTHETCEANLTITEPITSGIVTKKAVRITATNQVSGSVVTYQGGQSITLQPGFSAITAAGNYFQAITGGCP